MGKAPARAGLGARPRWKRAPAGVGGWSAPTLLVQMMTVLSAPPDAKRLPFEAYATE